MRIKVNGVHLFVDVEGAGLVADGPDMREKPTLIALHGGPARWPGYWLIWERGRSMWSVTTGDLLPRLSWLAMHRAGCAVSR